MQNSLHRRDKIRAYAYIAFWFVILTLVAMLATSCAPKPQAKAFELGKKPKVHRVYPATFYSDRR